MHRSELLRLADLALHEDLANGDLTSEAIVDEGVRAEADALAKSRLVVAGGPLFESVFRRLDPEVEIQILVKDGTWAEPGQVLWRVRGGARALLGAERAALNFVQRASGTATLTRQCVEALPAGSRTRITDTRKTTPGLRALERYAVRMGGGHNHRDNLGSAVLIKDNHIAVAGGVTRAVGLAKSHAPHTSRIEVEVTSLSMLDDALAAGADCVMLDNFSEHEIELAVARAGGRALLEVSGGVTLARVARLGQLGVDVISIGALTHSAPAADISLEMRLG